MQRLFWLFVGVVGLVATPLMVAQQREKATFAVAAVIEQTQDGTVNWTQGYVEAIGEATYPQGKPRAQARLLARRGAIMDAQRNLLEIVAGVRVSAESEMRDFIVMSDIVRTRVEGIVKGANIVQAQDLGDTYRVVMRIPMKGELAALANTILKEPEAVDSGRLTRERVERFAPPQLPEEHRFIPPEPPKVTPMPLPEVQEGPFTGLLIDCRGLGVKPSMSPKIRNAYGQGIWGTVQVSREFVIEHGIVGYLRDLKDLTHPEVVSRIGTRPLVIRAIGVGGINRTDPLVSEEDARRILEANGRYHFLDQMRVIFLIDAR